MVTSTTALLSQTLCISPQLCDTQDEVAQTLAGVGINGLGMFVDFPLLLIFSHHCPLCCHLFPAPSHVCLVLLPGRISTN